MGREVRRVPANWKHPKRGGDYIPLHDGYLDTLEDFVQRVREKGLDEAKAYFGDAPVEREYMPDWPESERTHYQMYETCTEGTPISPVMETPEELARWLADNGGDAFAGMTATYEQWLATIEDGSACSAVYNSGTGELKSGVEAQADAKD